MNKSELIDLVNGYAIDGVSVNDEYTVAQLKELKAAYEAGESASPDSEEAEDKISAQAEMIDDLKKQLEIASKTSKGKKALTFSATRGEGNDASESTFKVKCGAQMVIDGKVVSLTPSEIAADKQGCQAILVEMGAACIEEL